MTDAKIARSCGGCTACCKTFEIRDTNSLSGEWCRHCVIGKGCSIYETRPQACRKFECFWLRGKGEESDRPDRLNVVIDGTEVEMNGRTIRIVRLSEVETGARHQKRVEEITKGFIAQGFVVRHHECSLPGKHAADYFFVPTDMFTPSELETFKETLAKRSDP